ncbi:MAG: molybdopterin molybdotransferase MoeA [Myxococcales bacterium]|nr:molybdopterin molybdotransferase MoeA [Myxococcales bacterium]
MLTPAQALKSILQRVGPLEAERVPLLDAVDRVLAEPVVADRLLPAWDNSAMDGYAVRHADLLRGGALPVVGEIAAGCTDEIPLPPGKALRIFTGAAMPPGADTVLMQEDAQVGEAGLVATELPAPGANIRKAGSDVQPGQTVIEPGRPLTPGDVGLLAALGRSQVTVVRRPVVAIVSTGDELRPIDAAELARGQIRNSNAWMLAAAVKALGGVPRIVPVVPDDRDAVDQALFHATRADALLTTGGVSVGDHDHVGHALRELAGPDFAFWKVAIKPGKPLLFCTVGHCAVFGLPGNPVSAGVTFELFARPALLRLMGHTRVVRRAVPAVLDAPLPGAKGRQIYARATLREVDGALHVDPSRTQSSGALSSLAAADCLVITPPNTPAKGAGEAVQVLRLDVDDRVAP